MGDRILPVHLQWQDTVWQRIFDSLASVFNCTSDRAGKSKGSPLASARPPAYPWNADEASELGGAAAEQFAHSKSGRGGSGGGGGSATPAVVPIPSTAAATPMPQVSRRR